MGLNEPGSMTRELRAGAPSGASVGQQGTFFRHPLESRVLTASWRARQPGCLSWSLCFLPLRSQECCLLPPGSVFLQYKMGMVILCYISFQGLVSQNTYHTLSGLNNKQQFTVTQFWRLEMKVKVWTGLVPSKGCEGNICAMPLSGSW